MTDHDLLELAAPAVQGEPVAWINGETLLGITGDQGRRFQRCWLNHHRTDEDDTPLYTAPQPVEQQPAPDVTQLVEALEVVMWFGCNPNSKRGMWALEKANSALAAYRNQGDAP